MLFSEGVMSYVKDVFRNGRNTIFTATAWRNLITNSTDYGHTKAKSLIILGPNSNPHPNWDWDTGYKVLVFCRKMENMDEGLTVPKWVLIVLPKIPQMPQNLFTQFVCPSPKVLDFNEKGVIGRP